MLGVLRFVEGPGLSVNAAHAAFATLHVSNIHGACVRHACIHNACMLHLFMILDP